MIGKRLSSLSSTRQIFEEEKMPYEEALKQSGYSTSLSYDENTRFLAFWAPKFFGDLNQNSDNKISAKSSYLAILKISCKKIEKWRRSRKKCKVHFCKIAN